MTLFVKKLRELAEDATKAADIYSADPLPEICAKKHITQVVSNKKIWKVLDKIDSIATFVCDSKRFPCPTVQEYSTVFGNRRNPGTYAKLMKFKSSK